MQKEFAVITLLIVSSINGCVDFQPLANSIDKAVSVLDDAIFKLDNANADWQKILEDTRDQLTDSAQSTIRNEVSNTLTRAVAATGVEFRCDTDFIRTRVRQDLMRIRAHLLGETPPVVIPALCQVVPSQVDMSLEPNRRSSIGYYGYDFDAETRPGVFLMSKDGILTDVSRYLAITHHYQMTLNTGGNGVPISLNDKELILKWANLTLSEVPIIGPKCVQKIDHSQRVVTTFIPPRTRGDAEFGGNGPVVTAWVNAVNHRKYVTAYIYMKAKETKDDWTTAEGWTSDVILYTAPFGYDIIDVNAQPDDFSYTDTNNDPDKFDRGSGLVQRYVFVGDTDGDEAGTKTGVTVNFNPIEVVLKQVSDCIP